MDPDLISSDAAETIKVEIDPEDAVIMHYQEDSSDDDETNQYENNVFNLKEEILEEDRKIEYFDGLIGYVFQDWMNL